ncbi:MAG TPA: spore germination protein, partial [Bacillota bacterium]
MSFADHSPPVAIGDLARRLDATVDLALADLAQGRALTASLSETERRVREALGNPADLRARMLRGGPGPAVLVLYLEGLVDDALLHDAVFGPLRGQGGGRSAGPPPGRAVTRTDEAVEALLAGQALVQRSGERWAWAVEVRGFKHRLPDEPDLEPSIRGPREGLIEVLDVNVAAIRRRLATPWLRFEQLELGPLTRTRAAILYVAGRADPLVVATVRERLRAADRWDAVTSTQQLQELLEPRVGSLFPQVRQTERPDVCVAALAEGRIIVLLDGTPFALIVPLSFWDLLQSPDDYHLRWPFGVTLRLLRLAALLLML